MLKLNNSQNIDQEEGTNEESNSCEDRFDKLLIENIYKRVKVSNTSLNNKFSK